MSRMMEILAGASNIGVMGDLVDGASGVGTVAGEEGAVWFNPFLHMHLSSARHRGRTSPPCICSNCGVIEFLS